MIICEIRDYSNVHAASPKLSTRILSYTGASLRIRDLDILRAIKLKGISRMQHKHPNSVDRADQAGDNPALSAVIERNIRTIIDLRLKAAEMRGLQDRIADAITAFSGRMGFVYVHIVWFGLWFLLNTGRFGIAPFDPFPYGLLTMVVSLEAIFLATFVLISQNRLGMEAEHRADLHLHIGLLTEHELTRVLQMLDVMQDKMGIANDADSELADLEMDTRPEDVLAEIARLQHQARSTNRR
jgi:uncharacterized membrane protein